MLEKHGYLSTWLLREQPGVSRAYTYAKRFGSLAEAYRLAGYEPRSAVQAAAVSQETQRRRNRLIGDAANVLRAAGHEVVVDGRRSRLMVDHGLAIDVRACKPRHDPIPSWAHRTPGLVKAPLTLIARLDDTLEPVDYCLVAAAAFHGRAGIYLPATFEGREGIEIFTSLDDLYERCWRLLERAERRRPLSARS